MGLFVRSLVGLDREAAKQAFAGFVAGSTLTANQIEFVNRQVFSAVFAISAVSSSS
jgi:type I restriction enzyme R subunit